MNERCVALLGWPDAPTDAVAEYCQYLSGALSKHGIPLKSIHLQGRDLSWKKALLDLYDTSRDSPPTWYFLQYTALAWSRRGFPILALRVLRALKRNGEARCAVVFHDAEPYPGSRLIDKIRRAIQLYVMREAVRLSDLTILTVPQDKLSWIPKNQRNVVFVPVGANLPSPEKAWQQRTGGEKEIPTVAVFSVTGGTVGPGEIARIADAMRYASKQLGSLRLSVMGRHSDAAGAGLQQKLTGSRVEVVVHGLLDGEEVVRQLGASDVLLFTRGPISTRRGSAIAGIACGLPVVATAGWETSFPITEAGVVLLPDHLAGELGPALVRVLSDREYRTSLQERSQKAQELHFSWAAIAAKYVSALEKSGENQPKQVTGRLVNAGKWS